MFKGACTGTDRHDGSIEKQRSWLALDQVEGSNKGISVDGLNGWMDGHYMVTHLHAKGKAQRGRNRKGKVDTPVQGHIFLKRSASGPFSSQGTCASLCAYARACVCVSFRSVLVLGASAVFFFVLGFL